MGPRSELRHYGECPGRGYEDVGHRNVITTGAAHPDDVPGVDHLAAFTGTARELKIGSGTVQRVRQAMAEQG